MNKPALEEIIFRLKNPVDYESIFRIPIMEQGKKVGSLRAVPARIMGEAKNDALLITDWRRVHKQSFFTIYEPELTQTVTWLSRNYASVLDDVIFMVENCWHQPIGHLSLYNFQFSQSCCEFGRVNSSCHAPKGLMVLAAKVLLAWAGRELGVTRFHLAVFADNEKAVRYYKKLGFVHTQTVSYEKTVLGVTVTWVVAGQHNGIETEKKTVWEMELDCGEIQSATRGK